MRMMAARFGTEGKPDLDRRQHLRHFEQLTCTGRRHVVLRRNDALPAPTNRDTAAGAADRQALNLQQAYGPPNGLLGHAKAGAVFWLVVGSCAPGSKSPARGLSGRCGCSAVLRVGGASVGLTRPASFRRARTRIGTRSLRSLSATSLPHDPSPQPVALPAVGVYLDL